MRSALLLAVLGCGRLDFDDRLDGSTDVTDGHAEGSTVDAPDPRVFLYSMDRGTPDLHVFAVDLASGALSERSTFSLGAIPWFAVPSPSGTALYVGSRQTATVYTLRVDALTGSLTMVDQDPTSSRPEMGIVRPGGGALYVADDRLTGSQGVFGYTIANDDTLTPITGSPWPHGGSRTLGLAIHPMGRWLYAITNSTLHGYDIATTGELVVRTQIAWDTSASSAYDVVIEPSGRFGFVAPDTGAGIPGFTIDQSTGLVSTTPGSPFSTGGFTAFSADLTSDGKHLVVASNGTELVSAYAIDGATGSATHVPNSPHVPPGSVWGLAASPARNLFYVAQLGNSGILTYRIDASGLTELAAHPVTPAAEQVVLIGIR